MSAKRTREKHMTPTRSGTLAHIRIHGQLHRQHFPHGTDPVKIRQWLLSVELKYRHASAKKTGRFADDAAAYLAAIAAMPTLAQRTQHIHEWTAVFGDRKRDNITPDEIRTQLHRWRTEPRDVRQPNTTETRTLTLSAAAVNKRRTALMHLYSVLDGKAARNPVRDVPRFTEPAPAPRALAMPVVRAILDAVPACRNKARLMVLAYTGLPPAQIMQITAADVDLEHGTVAVPGRKKGRGTQGRILPLTPDGVAAFKLMAQEDAWGRFGGPSFRRSFERAYRKALKLAKAADVPHTPYDLRHSFGTEVYRRSGDIRATQVLMGHSTPQLTHRYTLAAVDPRLIEALKDFGK